MSRFGSGRAIKFAPEQNSFFEYIPERKNWKYRLQRCAVRGKKKRAKWFCSNFMSFSPIDFIFIGCIGYDDKFCWVLRNFDFKPANEIFSKKGTFWIFQKVAFLGVWCRKLSLRKIGIMDMSYIMDSDQNSQYTTFPNIFLIM